MKIKGSRSASFVCVFVFGHADKLQYLPILRTGGITSAWKSTYCRLGACMVSGMTSALFVRIINLQSSVFITSTVRELIGAIAIPAIGLMGSMKLKASRVRVVAKLALNHLKVDSPLVARYNIDRFGSTKGMNIPLELSIRSILSGDLSDLGSYTEYCRSRSYK